MAKKPIEVRPPEGMVRPHKVAEARNKLIGGFYDDPKLIDDKLAKKILRDIESKKGKAA